MTQLLTAPPVTTRSCVVVAQARNVVKTYGHGEATIRALDGADLEITAGAFTAIMGPSGSGKSTLMHALAGLDTVESGQVLLGGTDLTRLTERQRTLLRRDRIGFVFQSFNLVPALTAEENIALPLTLAGKKPDSAWLRDLVQVLGLADRLNHRPTELSGGQQQRVAVARALVARPDIVFADEPTGNLDSRHGHALLRFLRTASRDLGQTIVMVTHDPTAAAYADGVVFLVDGRVVAHLQDPTAATVLSTMTTLDSAGTTAAERDQRAGE